MHEHDEAFEPGDDLARDDLGRAKHYGMQHLEDHHDLLQASLSMLRKSRPQQENPAVAEWSHQHEADLKAMCEGIRAVHKAEYGDHEAYKPLHDDDESPEEAEDHDTEELIEKSTRMAQAMEHHDPDGAAALYAETQLLAAELAENRRLAQEETARVLAEEDQAAQAMAQEAAALAGEVESFEPELAEKLYGEAAKALEVVAE